MMVDDSSVCVPHNSKSLSPLYETLQKDCIEYLCHVALFQFKNNDDIKIATVQNDIQQCLYNLSQYKTQKEQISLRNRNDQPHTHWLLTPDNSTNQLYQHKQLTALYFDVVNIVARDADVDSETTFVIKRRKPTTRCYFRWIRQQQYIKARHTCRKKG
jgi:hypothetical protein